MTDDRELLKARFSTPSNGHQMPPPDSTEPPHVHITDEMSPNEPVMREGYDRIQLKVRRNQTRGLFGEITFSVHFIAELSLEANAAVKRYHFGKTILFVKPLELKYTDNILLAIWRFFWLLLTRKKWRITVNDVVKGRTIKCKDIIEMLNTEEEIKQASDKFAQVLRAASWFGGEELIDL